MDNISMEVLPKWKCAPEDEDYDVVHGVSGPSSLNPQADPYARAMRWRLEQNYEQRPRKQRKMDHESSRLPTKTTAGLIQPSIIPVVVEDDVSSELSADSGEKSSRLEVNVDEGTTGLSQKEQIREAQEELARIALIINENPEEHANLFRTMAQLAESPSQTVAKLALATQMTVFKDVIPGYRIRPISDAIAAEKVSKDVKRLRDFEQGLIRSYQQYVRQLGLKAQCHSFDSMNPSFSVAKVAISCACSLLLSVPHFNFRGELLQILVSIIFSKRESSSFQECICTLETLFHDDEDGTPSLDAVRTLMKAIKEHEYQINEAILNTFLHLRLLGSLSVRASYGKTDRPSESIQPKGKCLKQKRGFRTKKQRKILKEHRKVEQDFQEASAIVDQEEQEKIQSEILKLVFLTYFRILKARIPGLMGSVLEGLCKYTHLINQDFFGNILEALKDIILTQHVMSKDGSEDQKDSICFSSLASLRSTLLCITTAFTLLSHQDISNTASSAALALDLQFFATHLYRILYILSQDPDLEVSSACATIPRPDNAALQNAKSKVNASTTSVLLLRSLNLILTPRSTPPLKVAAFIKTLLISSLQIPEKSTLALLALLQHLIKVHGSKVNGLWDTEERKGDGVFDPLHVDIQGSNPFAGTIWEGELLRLHFSFKVKEGVTDMERLLKEP